MLSRALWRYDDARRPWPEPFRTFVVAPYAGGSAYSMYGLLGHLAAEDEQTIVLQYPGRGPRLGEPPATSLSDLADRVAAELGDRRLGRLVLVGHSLGGLLSFELAQRLERSGRDVELLVVSAARPPAHMTLRAAEVEARSPRQWLEILRQDGDTATEVLDDPVMRGIAVGVLRADTLLAARHTAAAEPLRCPMLIAGGDRDPDVLPAHLDGWRRLTSGAATVAVLSGGHFYYRAQAAELGALIRDRLSLRPEPRGDFPQPTNGEGR